MSGQHRRFAVAGLMALLVATVPAVHAQHGRWERLGSSRVDGRVDHDNISVGIQDGRFRAIQLRVRHGDVEFIRVVVHYADGEPEQVSVAQRIPAGGSTRPIDLRGNKRYLRSVELWYAKANWRTRPEVVLLGRR
jgi:hypothetical protein